MSKKLDKFNNKKEKDLIVVDGIVVDNLSNMKFRVKLIENDSYIIASVSGKIRLNYIRIYPGDKVKVEISPYDLTNGRITFRY